MESKATLPGHPVALLGAGLARFTAWLSGELVYRLRVGVDTDANLGAPGSLT
jgi:hypothetical protein